MKNNKMGIIMELVYKILEGVVISQSWDCELSDIVGMNNCCVTCCLIQSILSNLDILPEWILVAIMI